MMINTNGIQSSLQQTPSGPEKVSMLERCPLMEVENAASVAETITMHLLLEVSVSRVWRLDCITRLGNKITKAQHSNVHVC